MALLNKSNKDHAKNTLIGVVLTSVTLILLKNLLENMGKEDWAKKV